MPATIEAPRSAAEAAHLLARDGAHVHLVSEGHSTCIRATCGPQPAPIPAAVREHARLSRIALGFEIRQI
ncbi:hypothetical protein [Streptomyces alfalfae]|uniref:Uncharacterized protein n=1 Tax=Streptomyces alfalfae TaxID=1642299 RepID=A0A7T4PGI9_9ACTN|nr:hypothetical protein [Streptomyces alfalfae]QQC89842.1 hypothetical protein I8755_16545 [Streptomyces alfalfae]